MDTRNRILWTLLCVLFLLAVVLAALLLARWPRAGAALGGAALARPRRARGGGRADLAPGAPLAFARGQAGRAPEWAEIRDKLSALEAEYGRLPRMGFWANTNAALDLVADSLGEALDEYKAGAPDRGKWEHAMGQAARWLDDFEGRMTGYPAVLTAAAELGRAAAAARPPAEPALMPDAPLGFSERNKRREPEFEQIRAAFRQLETDYGATPAGFQYWGNANADLAEIGAALNAAALEYQEGRPGGLAALADLLEASHAIQALRGRMAGYPTVLADLDALERAIEAIGGARRGVEPPPRPPPAEAPAKPAPPAETPPMLQALLAMDAAAATMLPPSEMSRAMRESHRGRAGAPWAEVADARRLPARAERAPVIVIAHDEAELEKAIAALGKQGGPAYVILVDQPGDEAALARAAGIDVGFSTSAPPGGGAPATGWLYKPVDRGDGVFVRRHVDYVDPRKYDLGP